MPHAAPSPRTRVRRLHDKAAYDRAGINAIPTQCLSRMSATSSTVSPSLP